ncbi:MAG TPA: DUF5320 domain-containing protein [bacterium]|nr:DUF5320 domain-containing protein [bacterium]
MPNYDGTGPNGNGPMTGRGMGNCGTRGGRRSGCGMGCGCRGMRRMMPYQPTKDEYIKMLKEEMKDIQAELDELEKE